MYAPFGVGALIGRRDTFETGAPELCGGGTIKVVTADKVEWADAPERDEAGSPNVVGAVAFAKSLKILDGIGMDSIAEHEARLTSYALSKLNEISGVKIYGGKRPASAGSRLGVIPFNVAALPHDLTAAILSAEWGIGVRNGCFCAHPYVISLLRVPVREIEEFSQHMVEDDRRDIPGLVRISFGIYNTKKEVDVLADALGQIASGSYEGQYRQDKKTGEYNATNWRPNLGEFFNI
jgi:cysteine desulfurase / selenocysteine lyase